MGIIAMKRSGMEIIPKSRLPITLRDTSPGRRILRRIVTYDEALEPHLNNLPRKGLYVVCRDGGGHHTHRTYERLYKMFFENLNASLESEKTDAIPYMSPHKCRHTFATYMLRSGADIRAIQTLLGHATLKTTEIYTEVDVDDLKNNVAKLNFK